MASIPLWLIVLTGVQWLTGPVSVELLMRLILTFQLGLLLMAFVCLGRVAARLGTPGRVHGWSCVLLILIHFLAVKVFVNGQESAMQLLFLVLSLAVYVEMLEATGNSLCSEGRVRAATGGSSPTTAGFVLLGLGVAGLFLARLDAVFFLAGLGLDDRLGDRGRAGSLAPFGLSCAGNASSDSHLSDLALFDL